MGNAREPLEGGVIILTVDVAMVGDPSRGAVRNLIWRARGVGY